MSPEEKTLVTKFLADHTASMLKEAPYAKITEECTYLLRTVQKTIEETITEVTTENIMEICSLRRVPNHRIKNVITDYAGKARPIITRMVLREIVAHIDRVLKGASRHPGVMFNSRGMSPAPARASSPPGTPSPPPQSSGGGARAASPPSAGTKRARSESRAREQSVVCTGETRIGTRRERTPTMRLNPRDGSTKRAGK
jgi:hypothetical protein